jgi:hypothetical protein
MNMDTTTTKAPRHSNAAKGFLYFIMWCYPLCILGKKKLPGVREALVPAAAEATAGKLEY